MPPSHQGPGGTQVSDEGSDSELTCGGDHVTILAAEGPELESPGQGQVARQLHRVPVLPHVHQVTLGPAVCKITFSKSDKKDECKVMLVVLTVALGALDQSNLIKCCVAKYNM